MEENPPVLVLVTFGNIEEARHFARRAVSERLAACVNLFPQMESIYRWNGSVESAGEIGGIVKTTRNCLQPLESCYRSMHSYAVPEFLVLSVSGGGADYLKWLAESVSSPGG